MDEGESSLDHVALLRQVSIFAALSSGDLADLAARMRPLEAEAGTVIVSHEEPGDSLFVIAEGRVKVVLYGDTGREVILSLLGAGDFFGEMALLDSQPRSANVVAMESARLLALDREAFQTHLAAHPTTALAVLAEMSRRLRHADERNLEYAAQPFGLHEPTRPPERHVGAHDRLHGLASAALGQEREHAAFEPRPTGAGRRTCPPGTGTRR